MEGHKVWQEAKVKELTRMIEDYDTKPYKDARVVNKMAKIVENIRSDISYGRETLSLLGEHND